MGRGGEGLERALARVTGRNILPRVSLYMAESYCKLGVEITIFGREGPSPGLKAARPLRDFLELLSAISKTPHMHRARAQK